MPNKSGSLIGALIRSFWADRRGAMSVYLALFSILAIGAGAVAIDLGRAAALRAQMQNHADALALAGAVYLDGTNGARQLSEAVVRGTAQAQTNIAEGDGDLSIASVDFFSSVNPDVTATSDEDAVFVRVTLNPQTINYFFAPVLNVISETAANTSGNMVASATGAANPIVCNAPPLMMCDMSESSASDDQTLPQNAGRQVLLKSPQGTGNASWAPGNWGLLSTPDGDSGANAIEAHLAAVNPPGCRGLDVVETATGGKVNKVKNGVNARFGNSSFPYPAPNTTNYPRDSVFASAGGNDGGNGGGKGKGKGQTDDSSDDGSDSNPGDNSRLGSGDWDAEGYWEATHGGSLPASLGNDPTRYQVYLYELGETFARNGSQTIHPVPGGVPAGYDLVQPTGEQVPPDGEPNGAIAENGSARRLMSVALLKCVKDNVAGHGFYPTYNKLVEVFITEEVGNPPNAAIYAELVRRLTVTNSESVYANARLVE